MAELLASRPASVGFATWGLSRLLELRLEISALPAQLLVDSLGLNNVALFDGKRYEPALIAEQLCELPLGDNL